MMNVFRLSEELKFERLAEYKAFQKPVMRVRFDTHRQRLLAGGLDGQLKVFAQDEEGQLSVAYKIKMPEEITCMDVALDGNHYALGMATGGILIKSKKLDEDEESDTEE
jgi:hypothetical protein